MAREIDRGPVAQRDRRYPGAPEVMVKRFAVKGPSAMAWCIGLGLLMVGMLIGLVAGVALDHQELVAAACGQ